MNGIGLDRIHPDVQFVSIVGKRLVGWHEGDKFVVEGLLYALAEQDRVANVLDADLERFWANRQLKGGLFSQKRQIQAL